MSGELEVRALAVRLGGRLVIDGVDLDIGPGRFVALVGPNGSGKTTLLRSIYGAISRESGSVTFDGASSDDLKPAHRARLVAAMTQADDLPIGLSVDDVVALGRVPHLGFTQRSSTTDLVAVEEAIGAAGIGHLVDRPYAALSGGERQRVHLGRALAQQTPILLLDEPTNHLDVAAQFELLDAVRALDVTVVVSLHDLNLAATYADSVVVLAAGRVVAAGNPVDVLTPTVIAAAYGVHVVCGRHPIHGRLQLSFAPMTRSSLHDQTTHAGPATAEPAPR